MIKPHIFLDGERRYEASMHAVPRVGDTLRFHGEIYGKVTEVIWCLDENNLKEQRVNILVESEISSASPPIPETEIKPLSDVEIADIYYSETEIPEGHLFAFAEGFRQAEKHHGIGRSDE